MKSFEPIIRQLYNHKKGTGYLAYVPDDSTEPQYCCLGVIAEYEQCSFSVLPFDKPDKTVWRIPNDPDYGDPSSEYLWMVLPLSIQELYGLNEELFLYPALEKAIRIFTGDTNGLILQTALALVNDSTNSWEPVIRAMHLIENARLERGMSLDGALF